jgi:hypothetical protein
MASGRKTGGRKSGTPNKATTNTRAAIAMLIDGNIDKLSAWLDEIYVNDGPRAAFQSFVDVLEFGVPKLARTEVTGEGGGPVVVAVNDTDRRL